MNEKELKDALQEAKETLKKQKVQEPFGLCISANGIDIILSALEKQIPKKLKNQAICDGEFVVGDCPTCGERLYGGMFCHECGQCIDWSAKE